MNLSRRQFIRRGCCAAVGSTGTLSTLAQLRVIGAVAQPEAGTASDYKALVCLFLNGGNDAFNVVVPSDTVGYAGYAKARTVIAIPQSALLPISPGSYSDGRTYGFNPAVPELQQLFAAGKLAVVANVGTLVQPTTLASYQSGASLPPQLFSHIDQLTQWQSSLPDRPFQTGWGGRLADLVDAFNGNHQISMAISLGGQNSFQVGNTVAQFAVNPQGVPILYSSGPAVLPGNSAPRVNGVVNIMNAGSANLLGAAFAGVTAGAISDTSLLSSLLRQAPPLKTVFPGGSIASQLHMVATLISLASALNLKRQIFFCQIAGFDTHAAQLETHAPLLSDLSAALAAFYNATVELGVANQVVSFTASDFGRTYTPNSDGTDHGWGNHQFVLGGAVKGGDIYGSMPSLVVGGPDDTGQGRWIPSASVDEYSATLATWFGVSAANLPIVLPNIGRFARPNLGFVA